MSEPSPAPAAPRGPGFAEFVAAMAASMSLVALAIDAMLPAHGLIGEAFDVARANDTQYMVYVVFVGLAFGQILYGPLADAVGRKPAIYLGLAIFTVGTLVSLASTSYTVMLAGRLLQGIGVAGPRVISVTVVRDRFAGRQMARVMSFVISIFVIMPAVAPSIGQWLMTHYGWRSIFIAFLVLSAAIAAWFALRQPETLTDANRQPLSAAVILRNAGSVLRTRESLGYLLAAALISGAFVGFLGTAQQILQQRYGLGDRFPVYFALLALSVGASTQLNGRIVVNVGMRPLVKAAAVSITLVSALLWTLAMTNEGLPPFAALMGCLMAMFAFIGFLFGNLNALAMEPQGHIAGTAAAVIGALTTLVSAALGAIAGAFYNGTVIPLAVSFTLLGAATAVAVFATDARVRAAAAT